MEKMEQGLESIKLIMDLGLYLSDFYKVVSTNRISEIIKN